MSAAGSLPRREGPPGGQDEREATDVGANKYICNACGYIYDEATGDPDSGLAPGTRFADIPDDWSCPLCALTKADFVPYTPATPTRCSGPTPKLAPGGVGNRSGVLIVGGGRAGWQMAEALRALDAERAITLLSACAADVYDKPLLSVALARQLAPAALVRETGLACAKRLNVRLLAQTQALRISTRTRTVHSTRGTHPYDHLVLAHGAQAVLPQELPAELCWRVNHLDAYARLRQSLDGHAQEVLIVGAGLIGCELANDLALGGHRVQLLDVQDRPLARWPAEEAGNKLLQAWQGLPIQFASGVQVRGMQREGTRLTLQAQDGRQWQADQVIVAAGLHTPTRLAQSAGLAWNNGIAVDTATLRTSVADIYALGDCIAIDGHPSRYIEPIGRQARAIAAQICGCAGAPYEQRATPVRVKTSSLPLSLAA